MNQPKNYTAINASAGSGKTYTLVKRVLLICLKHPNQYDAVKHILALTFTNKAANEMKERILQWLKDFTRADFEKNSNLKGIQEDLEAQGIHVTLEDLHKRAQKVLDFILHHYSVLNIGTIDKFNARLVRSFSYELGLAHQFSLEIQSEPFLIKAVDKMLDEIGQNEKISGAFMDFINYNLDNDERININKTLYRKAKQFVSDVHYEELKNNENFDWDAYENVKNKLRNEIAFHKKEALRIATEAEKSIKDRDLSNSDFHGGSNKCIKYFFDSFLEKGAPKLMESAEAEAKKTDYYRNGASKAGKAKEHLVLEILDSLIDARSEIIKHYISLEKKSKILRELLPLKINKEIRDQLQIIEEEDDIVLLSKFNILINENLKSEPSGFIYEKIGTQYHHYFFDEFQDTSKMQWENIIPLKEHTVSSDNHTFTLVGDPKQSIYRFRGGDSALMLNILNSKEETTVPVNVEVLGNNWRSARNIVDFNNKLYKAISAELQQEHAELFSEKAHQNPQKKFAGRVHVNLCDYDKADAVFYEITAQQMHENIQKCLDNGYQFSDITILCRKGKEIQTYAKLLGNMKIINQGTPQYIKTISEKGLTLDMSYTLKAVMEYLRWEDKPDNLQYLIKSLYFLKVLGRIEIKDFTEEILELLKIEGRTQKENFLFEKYGLKLQQTDHPNLNLYNHVEFFVREFSVPQKETDFLLNFLEMLYNYTQKTGSTTKDLIQYWDEEGSLISIQASESIDAIKLMTIHAAKGLEFPIVFLPMQNSHKDGDFNEWFTTQEFEGLSSVNLKGFNKDFSTYDQEVADFNSANAYKNLIDRLCTQYVATTRPVEQLFLYLQKPSKEGTPSEIFNFISSLKNDDSDSFDIYPLNKNDLKKHLKDTAPIRNTLAIASLTHNDAGKSSIKIATPSKNYQNTVETVRTGIFTHEILSFIKTAKDLERVLEKYLLEGIITTAEKKVIENKIRSIIQSENYSRYFQAGLKILNEKDIMITENGATHLYRPDRMVETEEGIYIIDFKTGAEKEKHIQQVSTYRTVLESIGKKVAGTEVIYI